jgi:hypothetical protein
MLGKERDAAVAASTAWQARASDAEMALAYNKVLINDFARGLRRAIDKLCAGKKKA